MSYRSIRIGIAFCMMAALACQRIDGGARAVSESQAAIQQAPRPGYNVLLITLDTTRADRLGAYAYADARTPALDALATRGALFERAYTNCPLTLPAHASLLTGLQPPEHGLHINGGGQLGSSVPTLATVLRAEGYRTGAFVAAFVLDSKFGLDRGFQVYDDDLSQAHEQDIPEPFSVHRDGSAVVDAALKWLASHDSGDPPNPLTPNRQPPFFLWVHLYDPHYPYFVHEELAGTPFEGQASYDADIAFTDLQVKRLLDHLEQRGLSERTLVVAVADHGEGLEDHGEFEHGYLLNEEVLRIPLLMSLPGVVQAGARIDAIVSMVDLFPTILDVLDISNEPEGGARSLRPALAGKKIPSLPSYAESDMPYTTYGWNPLRSLTTPEWKYIRTTRPELYERPVDTREIFNLASARPEKIAAMDSQLASLERRMGPAAKAERVALTGKDRERMEALGYATNDQKPNQPPATNHQPPAGLKDIKEMLAVKQLDSHLFRGIATGTLTPERQIEMAQELIRRSPETAGFHTRLGTAFLNAAKPQEAIAPLSEALRLDPDSLDSRVNLGRALVRSGKAEEALAHFRSALSLDPDSVDAHFGLANSLADRGELDTACGHYREALRLAPDFADAHFNLANTLARRRKTDLAMAEYREVLRLQPEFAPAHFNLANHLAARGELDDAVAHYEQAARLEPEDVDIINNLGVALARQGKRDEAKARYAAAVKLRPDFARGHFNLGRELANDGNVAAALTAYAEAVRLWPKELEFASAYARLLATCGEPQLCDRGRAVEVAKKAVGNGGGSDPYVLDTLALAYAANGETQQAMDTAELALRLARLTSFDSLAAEIEARLRVLRNGSGSGGDQLARAGGAPVSGGGE